MGGILLILKGACDCSSMLDRAIEKATTEDGELVVLSILDPAVLQSAAARLTEQGQVGTTPSRGLAESVSARHEDLARRDSADAISRGEAASVSTRSIVRHGAYIREATEVIKELKPDYVMIEKRPGSLLRMRTVDAFLDGLSSEIGFDLLEVQ